MSASNVDELVIELFKQQLEAIEALKAERLNETSESYRAEHAAALYYRMNELKGTFDAAHAAALNGRMKELQDAFDAARAGAEGLLGRPLDMKSGCNYHAQLPDGCVDLDLWMHTRARLQRGITLQMERSVQIEGNGRGRRGADSNVEYQIEMACDALLCYLAANRPIDGAAFRASLSPHIDAMFLAMTELRELQATSLLPSR
jgi:hypothetical protein